jgi:hydroxymethylpyrimidine/phosphomethylpyrimidine kinase
LQLASGKTTSGLKSILDEDEGSPTMASESATPPLVLTIAGFDPISGAGISADLKTFAANNCYGIACITALTVQNSSQTFRFDPVSPSLLADQLAALFSDVAPRAIKIGMLANAGIVDAVADALANAGDAAVVLDPVLHASSGLDLLNRAGRIRMIERLFPLATVVTPNLDEAEELTGLQVRSVPQMESAARALLALGAKSVIITGGHLEKPVDLFHDGREAVHFGGDRVRTTNTHGTGCTFSAALAANLAFDKHTADAVVLAKAYVTAALRMSYPVGHGSGPLNHLFRLREPLRSKIVEPAPAMEHTTR